MKKLFIFGYLASTIILLLGCGNKSEVFSELNATVGCAQPIGDASSCTQSRRGNKPRIELTYGKDSFKKIAAKNANAYFEQNSLYTYNGMFVNLAEFKYNSTSNVEVIVELLIEYTELERRHQEWEGCGFEHSLRRQ